MTKTQLINTVSVLLVVLAIGGLTYFAGQKDTFTGDAIEPAAGVESGAVAGGAQAPAGVAGFQASCIVGDGQRVSGTVTPPHQNPAALKKVDVETSVGRMTVDQGACEYTPF